VFLTAANFFFEGPKTGPSFTEKLSPEALQYFNEVCKKPFSQQAIAFLNAYWEEAKDEAEFIYRFILFFFVICLNFLYICLFLL
jgi:hypothetical protein